MRILYASQRPPYPFFLGGAARSAHRLLVSLATDQMVACLAVGSSAYRVTPWAIPESADQAALGVRAVHGAATLDCGYPVRLLPDFGPTLARTIAEFAPTVIWSQLEGAYEALSLARDAGVQGVLYVHDAESDPAELRRTAALGCHLVCGSGYLARLVAGVIGRPTHVVYPASDWYFGTQGDPQGFVTMINPHAVKGLATFLALARRLPQQRFLLQESWALGDAALAALLVQLQSLPNVRFQRRVADMRSVYAQTRLLLVPSLWQEGFGMVAVEAQSCGIPVIASRRGGLPESVGDGGLLVDDHKNVDAWIQAIAQVLGDDDGYRAWSACALNHARAADFDPHELARRFLSACSAPAPSRRPLAAGVRAMAQQLGRLRGVGRFLHGGGR